MSYGTRVAASGIAAMLTVGLAACGSTSESDTTALASATSAASAVMMGSATDVAFAQSMIPHHEQAVEMSNMALDGRAEASPEVQQLAAQIKAAQDPEIQQMTQWLQAWGAPTSMPGASGDVSSMDHSGHDMGGITMAGMMTPEQMTQLEQATGSEFDTMWQTMMIEHHEGAITMAEQAKAESGNPQVVALADAIMTSQQAEIETMRANLAQ